MDCASGKTYYVSRELAEEALIEHRGRYHFRENSGPIAVYQCEDCGGWHFTSRGPKSKLLDDTDVRKRINDSRESEYWRNKLR